MNDQGSLVLFTKAALMLAEANTIQQCQELKSLALTAADWAKHKGAGAEAVKLANSYAYRAEIKMGEMLKATDRASGAAGIGPIAVTCGDRNTPPTLAELGVTKRESSEAQFLASLPEDVQEQVIAGEKTKQQVRREFKTQDSPKPPPAPPKAPNAAPIKAAPLAPEGTTESARIVQLERLLAEQYDLAKTLRVEITNLKVDKSTLESQLADMTRKLEESGYQVQEMHEENQSLHRVLDAEDLLVEFKKEVTRNQDRARVSEARAKSLAAQLRDVTHMAKSWKRKFEATQKPKKGQATPEEVEP